MQSRCDNNPKILCHFTECIFLLPNDLCACQLEFSPPGPSMPCHTLIEECSKNVLSENFLSENGELYSQWCISLQFNKVVGLICGPGTFVSGLCMCLSGFSSFLSKSNKMYVRLIGDSQLSPGVIVSLNVSMWSCELATHPGCVLTSPTWIGSS